MIVLKNIRYLLSVACLVILTAFSTGAEGAEGAESVQEPLADYLTRVAHSKEDNLISFTAKFGDNEEYVFISLVELVNGKAGNIWHIYSREAGGYRRLSEPVSLRKDALALANIAGIEGSAVITYWPQNAERGSLRAIQISGDEVITREVGEIEPGGKDKELYADLFLNETRRLAIDQRSVDEVLVSSTQPGNPPSTGVRTQLRETEALGPSSETASKVDDQTSSPESVLKEPGTDAGQRIVYTLLAVIGILLVVVVARLRRGVGRTG